MTKIQGQKSAYLKTTDKGIFYITLVGWDNWVIFTTTPDLQKGTPLFVGFHKFTTLKKANAYLDQHVRSETIVPVKTLPTPKKSTEPIAQKPHYGPDDGEVSRCLITLAYRVSLGASSNEKTVTVNGVPYTAKRDNAYSPWHIQWGTHTLVCGYIQWAKALGELLYILEPRDCIGKGNVMQFIHIGNRVTLKSDGNEYMVDSYNKDGLEACGYVVEVLYGRQ